MLKNKLFGLFTHQEFVLEKVQQIRSQFIVGDKIFEHSCAGSNEIFLSYTIYYEDGSPTTSMPNSLVIHREKKFNVLYSINALNSIVESTGQYKIDWEKYKGCLLTTIRRDLNVNKINVTKVHNI